MARIITLLFAAGFALIFAASAANGAEKTPVFYRVNIKAGYLNIRETASVKATASGVFYAGDDCIPAAGESKKQGGRKWVKVFHPYLRSTGWADARFLARSKADCNFEKFLFHTRSKADWVFDAMDFPLVISSPNVEELPASYSKEDVLASKKNLYDGPYYYLRLLDGAGMKRFWAERDGCAKYYLIENKNYDINLYQLYIVKKTRGAASLTISCLEMYPEFQFKETKNGYTLTGIVDSGS